MSGAAFLRIKRLKGGGIIASAARHNRRVIQAEKGTSGSIDPARSHLNETLQGPPTADDVAQLAKDMMRAAGITKLRKDAVLGLEIVFSLPIDHQLDDRAFFTDCATWAATQFGGTKNILSVDIHRDEAAPHCHVLMLPLLDGRMIGSEMMFGGGKKKLLALQKDFHESVASRYGLMKAPAKLSGHAKQSGAAAVIQRLRNTSDPAMASAIWPQIREAIEHDPAPSLLALGIEQQAPKKKLRTMAQIFTSTGKGSTRRDEPNPIGFPQAPKRRTLCSVGFSPESSLPTSQARPPDIPVDESKRIRDSDLDPALFDPITGEFLKPHRPERINRAAADTWVSQALSSPWKTQ
jgi:hypothetical protein